MTRLCRFGIGGGVRRTSQVRHRSGGVRRGLAVSGIGGAVGRGWRKRGGGSGSATHLKNPCYGAVQEGCSADRGSWPGTRVISKSWQRERPRIAHRRRRS